jgi:hypothetical protein
LFDLHEESTLHPIIRTTLALPTVALATCLLSTASAHASTASIGHLRVRVVDLDLSDGITAAVSLKPGSTALQATRYDSGGPTDRLQTFATIAGATGPLSVGDSAATATALSWGGDMLSPGGWSGTASANIGPFIPDGGVRVDAKVFLNSFFTLTAHTMLVLTVDTATMSAPYYGDGFARADMFLTDSTYTNKFNSSSTAGPMQISFANVSGASTDGLFSVQLWAAIYAAATAPVPEPQSATLLLAGLAVVARLARRRQR